MKHSGLNLPAHCTMIEENELPEIYGGGSILSFIQYLLSGFTINFGWGADNDSYDTTVTTGRPGWGWGGNTSHSSVDTSPSGGYRGPAPPLPPVTFLHSLAPPLPPWFPPPPRPPPGRFLQIQRRHLYGSFHSASACLLHPHRARRAGRARRRLPWPRLRRRPPPHPPGRPGPGLPLAAPPPGPVRPGTRLPLLRPGSMIPVRPLSPGEGFFWALH